MLGCRGQFGCGSAGARTQSVGGGAEQWRGWLHRGLARGASDQRGRTAAAACWQPQCLEAARCSEESGRLVGKLRDLPRAPHPALQARVSAAKDTSSAAVIDVTKFGYFKVRGRAAL